MEESKYPFVNFCNCLDKVSEAEHAHDLKAMQYYLKKAETYPIVVCFQKWMMEYTQNMYKLLHDDGADKHKVTQKLLELRKEAIYKPKTFEDFDNSIYRFVKEYYARLLLYVLQENCEKINFLPEYEELCLELMEIMETERWQLLKNQDYYSFIHTLVAGYYENLGRPSVAQKYYKKVWYKYKTETNISIFCFRALCKYLKNMVILGNIQNIFEVESFMLEKIKNDQIENSNDEELDMLIHTFLYELIHSFEYTEHPEVVLDSLESLFKENVFEKNSWNEKTLDIYLLYLIKLNERNQTCSLKRQLEIKSYLKKYKKEYGLYSRPDWQIISYYSVWYNLLKMKKNKKAFVYIEKIMETLLEGKFDEADRISFLAGISFVIDEYKGAGQKEKALKCAEYFMIKNVGFYAAAEFFLDNENMEKYLEICDFHFQYTYQAVADIASKKQKFEFSINCKKILSSAIRLRNKLDVTNEEKIQFRKKNPNELQYFELEMLEKSIPENTAVIDFLYLEPEIYKTKRRIINNPARIYDLEIFVMAKKQEKCITGYKSIPEANTVNEKIITLMNKMKSGNGKMQKLSEEIYKELILDFNYILEGIEYLWICPDGILCNFSFDTLFLLVCHSPSYSFTYWQSLRDIFEVWKENKDIVSSCMVGNPKFELKENKNHIVTDEAKQRVITQLTPLPYSGYEAIKLAGVMHGDYFINERATKFVLKHGYKYIHIATHGFTYTSGKSPWYDSMLAFSGVQNYLAEGTDIEGYGNGLLSAEEISKMNFSGTEVVVLSACGSGNSIFSEHRQETGLHVAFGVAGVKYIISALWEVDDFATSVLMNYFYDNIKKGISVPMALYNAKLQLKKTTTGELTEIIKCDKEKMPESCMDMLLEFEQLPDNYCYYSSIKYWGSFICNRTAS